MDQFKLFSQIEILLTSHRDKRTHTQFNRCFLSVQGQHSSRYPGGVGAQHRIFRRGLHVRGNANPLREGPEGRRGQHQGEPRDGHEGSG